MPKAMTDAMTADEFFEWCHRPENRDKYYELERGRVVELPPPGQLHGSISMNAGYLLNGYVWRRKKGSVSGDAGVIVERDPDTVRGPDLAYYDITPRYADIPRQYAMEPPKLIVEIVSPNDRMGQIQKRVTRFHRMGVDLIWVIDPEDRLVMVFRPGEFTEVLTEEEELTGNGVLPEFRCRVADFFYMSGEPEPGTPTS